MFFLFPIVLFFIAVLRDPGNFVTWGLLALTVALALGGGPSITFWKKSA